MSAPRTFPAPTLHSTIAALIAARPAGITTGEVRDAVVAATGCSATGQVLRTLGMLLITGEIDERDGMWVPSGSARAVATDGRCAA